MPQQHLCGLKQREERRPLDISISNGSVLIANEKA